MDMVLRAIQNDSIDIIKLMFDVKGLVDWETMLKGMTLAIKMNKLRCIKLMLAPNLDDYRYLAQTREESWLHLAATLGQGDTTEAIIKAKLYDVDHRISVNNSTALHFASRFGKAETIRVLIENEADVNCLDKTKSSPLILVAKECFAPNLCMQKLIDGNCNLDLQDDISKTALHYCCKKAIGVEMLLKAGANPNLQDIEGNTPMHCAAQEGFDTVICLLMNYRADPDIINKSGRAPIHYLAMKNHWNGIESIAKGGGSIDILDGTLRRPIWYAITHNRMNAFTTLLQYNCNIHSERVDDKNDPILTALTLSSFDMVAKLLLAGAEPANVIDWLDDYHDCVEYQKALRNRGPRGPLEGEEEIELPGGFSGILVNDYLSEESLEELNSSGVVEWLRSWVTNPRSLKQQCRVSIREHMGRRMTPDIKLPVPLSMKLYLTLFEIGDNVLK